jgi:hypothetical protein
MELSPLETEKLCQAIGRPVPPVANSLESGVNKANLALFNNRINRRGPGRSTGLIIAAAGL